MTAIRTRRKRRQRHGTAESMALAIELWLGHTYGVKSGLWPAEGTPERLQAMSWSTWAYVTYGAQLVRLQAAKNMGTPDDAHGTAAHKALDELLTVLGSRFTRQPAP